MTYGENVQQMRDSVAWLLGRHRIQQQLGGPGSYTMAVSSTEADRQRMGQVIRRYRDVALTWCLEAVTAASPKTDVARRPADAADPAAELRYRLDQQLPGDEPQGRLVDLLASSHDNPLLDAWQRTARAAALGEHDFAAGVNLGRMTVEQARTVLKDAADLTRGLVLLDRRYHNVPGWRHLKAPARLERAGEHTSLLVSEGRVDLNVDEQGWRPRVGVVPGPVPPGVTGAVQAQRNLVTELAHFPNALNLRRVLHSQAAVSREAAWHASAVAPDLETRFNSRVGVYRGLVRSSRDLGGLIGDGGHAVVQSQNAVSALACPPSRSAEDGGDLRELARWCMRTDARVAAIIEHGLDQRLYLVAVNQPRLLDEPVRGVHPLQRRWVPASEGVESPLRGLAVTELRPPRRVSTDPRAHESRAAYEAVLTREMGPATGAARGARR